MLALALIIIWGLCEMRVRQTDFGRVTPDAVNEQKISGFTGDGGASQIGGALNNVAKAFQQQQLEVDKTHAEEARLNFDRDITTILHDADNGYFNSSGKDAYDKQEDTRKAIEAARQLHAKNLSPEQAKMFGSVADRMVQSNYKAVMTHASRGRKAWEVATQEAVVENSVEKATLNFENDEEIAVQLATMRNSVKESSGKQGIGPEATNERLQTMTSKFYSSVIGRAIETNSGRATDLFARVSKHLEPADRSKVERVLKAQTNKESAMNSADDWMRKGYDVTKGMEEAAKIKDPELREATENRFRHLKSIDAQAKKASQNEMAESVIKRMQDGLVKSDIPVQEWDAMSASQRTAVNNYEKNRIAALEKKDKLYEIKETELYEDQIELYHQAIRDGQIELSDLPAGDRAAIKQSDYKALQQTQKDTNPEPEARKHNEAEALVNVDNLAAAGDFADAKDYLLSNVDKFKPETFNKYLTRINKGINDPKGAHEVKSLFTDRQDLKRMFPDDEEKADLVLAELDDWYVNFQQEHDRLPTVNERKAAKADLVLSLTERLNTSFFKSDDTDIQEQFIGKAGKSVDRNILIQEVQSINEMRAKNNLAPLSEGQIKAYQKRKYETKATESKAKYKTLTDHVKKTESFSATPYWDNKQYTNGYGTKAKHKNERITKAEAQKRFDKHLEKDIKRVEAFVPSDTPQGIKNALASLSYNAGYSWMKAGLGKAIQKKDWKDAKRRFLQYNKSDGKKSDGLVNRRKIEAEWFNG